MQGTFCVKKIFYRLKLSLINVIYNIKRIIEIVQDIHK